MLKDYDNGMQTNRIDREDQKISGKCKKHRIHDLSTEDILTDENVNMIIGQRFSRKVNFVFPPIVQLEIDA